MREFLFSHSELMFTLIGVVIIVCVVKFSDYWMHTKFSIIAEYFLMFSGIIGSATIVQTIGKWFLK